MFLGGCAALSSEARWCSLYFISKTRLYYVTLHGRWEMLAGDQSSGCCRDLGVVALSSHRCQHYLTPPQQQTNSLDTKGTCTVTTTPERRTDTDAGPHLRPMGSGRTSSTHCTGARMEKSCRYHPVLTG